MRKRNTTISNGLAVSVLRLNDTVVSRGLATETRRTETASASSVTNSVSAGTASAAEPDAVSVSVQTRGGGTLFEERWRGGKWRRTRTADEYGADGCRRTVATVETSDGAVATNSVASFDFLGRLVASETPLSCVSNFYDGASSRVVSTFDAASGVAATNVYDAVGDLVGVETLGVAEEAWTSYEIVSGVLWRVTAEVRRAGAATNSCVVVRERLTGLSDALRGETEVWENGAPASRASSSFDPESGVLTETAESAAAGASVARSKFGRVFETESRDGVVRNFFDPYGRVFYREVAGRGGGVWRSLDWIGRDDAGDVEEYDEFHRGGSQGNFHATFHAYDAFGNRVSTTDALGAAVTNAFDAAGRATAVGGAAHPVLTGWDAEGRRVSLATTKGAWDGGAKEETRWTYDAATGLCTAKEYADGSTVEYTHAADGLPLRTTFASGRWTENVYDSSRRLVAVRRSDGDEDGFAYDVFGAEASATNRAASLAILRDSHGAATNEVQTVGAESFSLSRTFDAHGRPASSGGAVYAYDSDGRLASITTSVAAVEYRYDDRGFDAGYTVALAGGAEFSRTLLREGWRRSLVTNVVNAAGGVSAAIAYSHDALGRPTARNSDSFGYNATGEVSSASVGGISAAYTYDDAGNLRVRDGADRLELIVEACNALVHAYSPAAVDGIRYEDVECDADGNLTRAFRYGPDNEGTALEYGYDAKSRLVSFATNGSSAAEYAYDAKSRRVRKATPEAVHTYFYDGWMLVEERIARAGGANSTVRYVWGRDASGGVGGAGGVGGLLYLVRDGDVFVPFYDAYGNVVGYWDSDGEVVASYVYDAFGRTLSQSGPLADSFAFRYSTKYFDEETGCYHYGHRYYSPRFMRWLTRDPLGEDGGVNLYAFCGNDPLSYCDPLGEARMITGALLALNGTKRHLISGYDSARNIVRLVNELNSLRDNGKQIYDAKICDLVSTSLEELKREIAENGDNVYIVAHGGINVDGRTYRGKSYVWENNASVQEMIYPTGRSPGLPISSLGGHLNMQNVFGCFLSSYVRKVPQHVGWSMKYVSYVDDYGRMYESLLARLRRYAVTKHREGDCPIKIRIYEGEMANEAERSYATTENVLKKYPPKDESAYKR